MKLSHSFVRFHTLSVARPFPCLAVLLLAACASPNASELGATEGTAVKSGEPSEPATSSSSSTPASTPSAPADEPRVQVEVFEVRPRAVQEVITATGELRADEQVDLRSEVAGRITELHFKEGQAVRSGDLLVKINDADLVAERRRVAVQRDLAQARERRSKTLLVEETLSPDLYEEARGRLLMLEAQLEQIDAQIAKTEIRAPFSGVVGLREVSEGSYLTPTATVARLQSLNPVKLDFSVPEKYIGAVRPGAEVELRIVGQESSFQGKVYAVEPRIDPETRTVQARARVANPDRLLFPGAFAKVSLMLDEQGDALLVPSIALVPGLQATTVYVIENGVTVARSVDVGRRTEDRVQILSGLSAGDRVVVTGVQQVRPGTAVEARTWEGAR